MKKLNVLSALILILAMFAIAKYTGQKEIIFPEIAALVLGERNISFNQPSDIIKDK